MGAAPPPGTGAAPPPGADIDGTRLPPRPVIADLTAVLIALWPLSLGLTILGRGPEVWPWPGFLGAFVLSRFFFTLMRPEASWRQWRQRPASTMLPAILSGGLAAVLAALAAGFAHGYFA
ncbi:MAG: hypothetical protein AAF677_16210 [Pseudomonadota bacterium]